GGKRPGGEARVGQAGCCELAAGGRDSERGDAEEMQALPHPCLTHKHSAKLAGADQAKRKRPPADLAFEQFAMKVHVQNGNTAAARVQAPSCGLSLLAEGARDKGLHLALIAGRTARHVDLGRAYLSCRHAET